MFRKFIWPRKRWQKIALGITLVTFTLLLVGAFGATNSVATRYESLLSVVIYDRNGAPIGIKENAKGHYAYTTGVLPQAFASLLIKKEDALFYYHPGINPFSIIRATYHFLTGGEAGGSSTITQQLAKNLLHTETERTIKNKLKETLYALGLELRYSKDDILLMYANTVYLGHQLQGFESASLAYFDKPLTETTLNEQLSLLATLSHPSTRNPWEKDNLTYATALSTRLDSSEPYIAPPVTDVYSFQHDALFELNSAGVSCTESCATTIDDTLSEDIRGILARHIEDNSENKATNGAIVVIDAKTSELLVFIGSRDPAGQRTGDQINMAIEPRPIGSTIKPFIYAAGFRSGLRPYSLVEDREYKYPIATGFALYPKNFDGLYRGEVTLHEALSNSLNVPSVKILEFIGLEEFYSFLSGPLGFEPIQDYQSYQYGIALGGLEMDLLTLTHYFTLFPRGGTLEPLRLLKDSTDNFSLPPQSHINKSVTVIDTPYIELVNAILSDRFAGVDQFGLNSNLNLTISNYSVKTGTSRDFHDSWIVGYTPDLVVGVWLGNSENTPLEQVTGQSGAGAIWHDVMEYLANTPYYHDTRFSATYLERFPIENNDEWGLLGDVVADHRTLLQQDNLILSIHEGDTYELGSHTIIPLKARKPVRWSINDQFLESAKETTFTPTEPGTYEVFALDEERGVRESLFIHITEPR